MASSKAKRLASLHAENLPESFASRLGDCYLQSFYSYLLNSKDELVLTDENSLGDIQAACVVSFDPKTLDQRLLFHTPLLGAALLFFWRLPLIAMCKSFFSRSSKVLQPLPKSELILIYTDSKVQSQGAGRRLIQAIDKALERKKIFEYQVKTLSDKANRALAFYLSNGFEPLHELESKGRRFQVFKKSLLCKDLKK